MNIFLMQLVLNMTVKKIKKIIIINWTVLKIYRHHSNKNIQDFLNIIMRLLKIIHVKKSKLKKKMQILLKKNIKMEHA